VHDFLPGIIPKMSLIRTLSDTDLAIDTQFRIAIDNEIMIILVDRLEKQIQSPHVKVAKKVIF